MSKIISKDKYKKFFSFVISVIACLAVCCVCAFAEEATGTDVSSIATNVVSSVATDLIKVIGVVVAGITGVLTLKIGVTKAIAFIKTMIGKAG